MSAAHAPIVKGSTVSKIIKEIIRCLIGGFMFTLASNIMESGGIRGHRQLSIMGFCFLGTWVCSKGVMDLAMSYLSAAVRLSDRRVKIAATIELLRRGEGNAVTIVCENPDYPDNNLPRHVVDCCGDWTGWVDRRYGGGTLDEALRTAVKAREFQELLNG